MGGANLDIVGRPFSNLEDRDSNPGTVRFAVGGVARNIGENLCRLGHEVELIASVGSGPDGRMILDSCRAAGMGVDHCIFRENSASVYMALCDETGEMLAAVNDMSAVSGLTPGILADRQKVLLEADLIVADANPDIEALGYLAGMPGRPELAVDAVSAAKAGRIKGILNRIHSLKLNRLEAEKLCGADRSTNLSAEDLTGRLNAEGVERVFLSLGAEGLFWNSADGHGCEKSRLQTAVDVTGAGDAQFSGILHGLLTGVPLSTAIEYGMVLAELTAGCDSAVNPGINRSVLDNPADCG